MIESRTVGDRRRRAPQGRRSLRLRPRRRGKSKHCARQALPIPSCRGITAGLGAAAQFEVPLTFRHEALRITFLTAHKARERAKTVDWSTLTDERMTVVVYMGMTAAPSGSRRAARRGDARRKPRSACSRGLTRLDAQAAVGTLDQFACARRTDRTAGPAILIIGDVVAHSAPWRHPNLNHVITQLLESCRMTSPLEQKKIRITGPSVGDRQPHLGRYRDLPHRSAGLVGRAVGRRDRCAPPMRRRGAAHRIGRRRCRRDRRLHRAPWRSRTAAL